MNGMRMFRVVTRIMTLWALVSIVSGDVSYGQQITAPLSKSIIPQHHQYMHFLRYQMLLDNKAAFLDQQGQSAQATVLRNHLQKDLQFTDAQIGILRTAGLQMKSDLAGIQAQAMPIVSQDRQWLKANGRKAGPPPGASQVHQLQQQRETLLQNMVNQINAQLGSQASAILAAYVASHVVGQSTHLPSQRTKLGTVPKQLVVNQ